MSCDIRAMWEQVGGKAPKHWGFTTLEKLLESPKSVSVGVMYPGQDTVGGVPLIKVSDVKNGAILGRPDFCISTGVDEEYKRTRLNGTELLITLVGNPGDCALVTNEMKGWNAARALAVVRLKEPELREWLRYVLLSKPAKHLIDARLNTTVQKTLNLKDVKELPIPLPPIDERLLITKNIRDIEGKANLNTQTNQTLEEMAQAIFKSWFVDFDPVKAKMNGEQPEGMDEATASLFPEKLDSETGIPDGWTQGSITDIAKLNAKSWTKKNSPEQVHYVDLANTKNGVIESVTTYDFEESPSRARRILNSGDTIVGTVRPGNRSYAFIGDTEKPLTGSTGFAVLSPKKSYWTSFVYLATTNDDSIDEYARLAGGGAYPAIKPAVVADTQCAIPTEDIAKKFWELTGPMLRKAHQNRLQNEDLAALRDTLLPKLLSGEIELGNTEKLAEVS